MGEKPTGHCAHTVRDGRAQQRRADVPRNQQIADHLGLTRTTVSNHLKAYREGIKANDKHRETLENYTELVLMHTLRLSRTQVAAQRLLLECAGLLDQQQSVTKQQEKQDIVINLSKDIALDVE